MNKALRLNGLARLCIIFLLASPGAWAEKLPQEIGRFNPAGLSIDWGFEGVAFLALKSAGPDGATVPVHRLYHPTHGYLLTVSDSEVDVARKQGFIYQGTAFFAPRIGGSPVYRYRTASTHVFLFTAGKESPYQVGVFYFGSFSPSATGIIAGTQRVYGRAGDWWGGVKDFYGAEPGVRQDRRGWTGDFSELKPAIGYYNQQSTEVLEKHIQEAAEAGISFFSFYWYWSGQKQGELYPEALHSFLSARNSALMHFSLTLYAHPWASDMAITTTNARSVVDQLVHYFRMPQYLRLPDGRPVFSIGDARNIRPGGGTSCTDDQCYAQVISNFLGLLSSVSKQELGVVPFVEIQAGVPTWDQDKEIDGISCLVPPIPIAGGTSYPVFSQDVYAQLTGPGKPVSPCMLENFDERPRQDILIPDRNAVRYFIGKSNDKFRHNLEITRRFSDANFAQTGSPASHIIMLYAWNEWHEGGIIEPNATTGATTLNVVTDVFQLPRLPSPCLDEGRCGVPEPAR